MDKSVERALAIAAKRAEKQKDIHLPTLGVDITIKKIGPNDYFIMGVPIPTEIIGKNLEAIPPQSVEGLLKVIFGRGIVSPRVQMDKAKPLKVGEIYRDDLDDDFGFIIKQVSEFSAFKEAADQAAGFPEEPQNQSTEPSDRSNSEKIRGAPA